jgi:outer membrane receptor protein involved in Fe transport
VDGVIEAGSLGTVRARVGTSGGRNGWTWHLAADRWQSDGFTGTAPATLTRVSNDDGDASHIGVGSGWSGRGREVRGQAQFSRKDHGFPGAYGSNPIDAYTEIDTVSRGQNNRNQVGVHWSEPFGGSGRLQQRTSVTFADFDSSFVSPFGTSEFATRRVALRTQTDAAFSPGFGLSAGVELQRERAWSTFITGTSGSIVPVQRWLMGYFGEARLAPATNWSIAAGLRVEQIRRDALDADPFAFQPRPAFPGEPVVSVNPKVSLAYRIPGSRDGVETRLRVSTGTGIRPPDAFEIGFTDNAALKPERSRSVDAGIQQTFAAGRMAFEGTVFLNSYDDLIVAVGRAFGNASRFRTDNISNARALGLELGGSVRPDVHLNVRATYTFLSTEILSVDRAADQAPAPFTVGEALIRRPRHQGTLAVTYARGRVAAFSQATFRGQVRDIEPSVGAFGGVFTAAGYGVVDLGASVRLVRSVDVVGRLENVGDRRYESAYGFPAPGALAFVGIRFAASR